MLAVVVRKLLVFNRELLLLETVRDPRGKGTSAIEAATKQRLVKAATD
jgi:hypothetical protein